MHLEIPEALDIAKLHRRQGRLEEARTAFQDIIRRAPDNALARHGFAGLMHDMGESEKAAALLNEEIDKDEGNASLHRDLGVVLFHLRDFQGAIESWNRSLELRPGDAGVFVNLGHAHLELHRWPEAAAAFRRALKLDPERVEALANLGHTLYLENRLEESTTAYRRALQLSPGLCGALSGLASIAKRQGRTSRAVSLYRQALKEDPNDARAQHGLAIVKAFVPKDPRFAQIERALDEHDLNADDRNILLFVLGQAYDDIGAYDDAFATIRKANEERRKLLPHDRLEDRHYVEQIIAGDAAMNPDVFAGPDGGAIPVFAAGLSRSGKSLIETLLSRSGKVRALGEKTFFYDAMREVAEPVSLPVYPACIPQFERGHAAEIGRLYQEKCAEFGIGSETRTFDTSPDTYLFVGMVLRCLPRAKIVLCQRNEMDLAKHIYFSRYYMKNSHAYDLADVASHIANSQRLAEHWVETYGEERIICVQYEDLVTDPRQTINKVTDFLGLKRLSGKATKDIHSSEVGHWQNYKHHLGELRAYAHTEGSSRVG